MVGIFFPSIWECIVKMNGDLTKNGVRKPERGALTEYHSMSILHQSSSPSAGFSTGKNDQQLASTEKDVH